MGTEIERENGYVTVCAQIKQETGKYLGMEIV